MSDAHRDEIEKLESLYAQNPEGRIFTHLAEAYRKAGELERAREVLDAGIERHPDYSSAHVVLGRVLMDMGENDSARAEFRRVLELDGQNLVALRSLGDITRAEGRDDEALEYYERLLDQEPSDDEVRDIINILTGTVPVDEEPPTATPTPGDEWALGAEEFEEPTLEEPGSVFGPVEPVEDEEPVGTAYEAEPEPEPEPLEPLYDGEREAEPAEPTYEAELEPLAEPEETASDQGAEWEPWAAADDRDEDRDAVRDEAVTETDVEQDGWPFDETEDELEPQEPENADVMTETIAQVYARQGLYDRAIEVYQGLIRSRPDDEGLRERLAEIEAQAAAEADEAAAQPEPGDTAEEAEPWETDYTWDDSWQGTDEEPEPAVAEDEATALEGEWDEPAQDAARDEEEHPAGFEVAEFSTDPAEEVAPIEGLETEELEPDTGLVVTPEDGEEPVESVEAEAETEGTLEGVETEPHESPWMVEDWSEVQDTETPYAWAEAEEAAEDDSAPIHHYLQDLLSWSGGIGDASGADEGPGDAGTEGAAEPTAPSEVPGDDADDDDLEMFRSWLESLKE